MCPPWQPSRPLPGPLVSASPPSWMARVSEPAPITVAPPEPAGALLVEAKAKAAVLREFILSTDLVSTIGNRPYVRVAGWQFLADTLGVSAVLARSLPPPLACG